MALEVVREIYDAFARRNGAAIDRLRNAIDSAVTVERFIAAGEQVAVVGRTRGHTRSGAVPFDVAIVHVWTTRDARISRFEAYVDTPAMLAALAVR